LYYLDADLYTKAVILANSRGILGFFWSLNFSVFFDYYQQYLSSAKTEIIRGEQPKKSKFTKSEQPRNLRFQPKLRNPGMLATHFWAVIPCPKNREAEIIDVDSSGKRSGLF